MALAAATVWEVRTTGAATNGGGFNASRDAVNGVDYSQQDAAQLALTDLAMAQSSTTLTSVTGGFTHAMEGNIIYIASGTNFIAGYYEIVTYTNANTVVLDRTAATAGAGSAGVGNVGGGSNHPDTIRASVVAGNKIYIQNGTYVRVGANDYVLTVSVSGTAGNKIRWIGYITNHTTVPTGTNRPVLSAANTVTNALVFGSTTGNSYENLICYDATSDGIVGSGTGNIFINVRSYSHGGDGWYIDSDNAMINCESDNNSQEGLNDSGSGDLYVYYCYFHDNTNSGFSPDTNAADVDMIGCISESNSGHGFDQVGTSNETRMFNCLAYNNTGATSDGFVFTSTSADLSFTILMNNSAVDNGRYGFNSITATSGYSMGHFDFNNYNGNGTAGLNNITAGPNDNTNDPQFTNAAAGNFTLLSSDTALLAKGFPNGSIGGGGAVV